MEKVRKLETWCQSAVFLLFFFNLKPVELFLLHWELKDVSQKAANSPTLWSFRAVGSGWQHQISLALTFSFPAPSELTAQTNVFLVSFHRKKVHKHLLQLPDSCCFNNLLVKSDATGLQLLLLPARKHAVMMETWIERYQNRSFFLYSSQQTVSVLTLWSFFIQTLIIKCLLIFSALIISRLW